MDPEALLRDIEAIKQELEAIKEALNKRPQPATVEQVRGELVELKKAIQERPNSPKIDEKTITALQAGFIEQVRQIQQQIPSTVTVKGDFYGFTSWKPFAMYLSLLPLCGALCTFFWHQGKETVQYRQNVELLKECNYLNTQIEAYRKRYPKYSHLFTPYDDRGFWARYNNSLVAPQESRNAP